MTDGLSPTPPSGDKPILERRRSKNPIRNMMQHLTVDPPDTEPGSPGRDSLIRRLSWRKSRSPSAHSDTSAPLSATVRNSDPALCDACSSLAVDIENTLEEVDFSFTKAFNAGADDSFDGKEQFVSRLRGLEENRWAARCPLCKLFWAVHISGQGEGEYCLSAFSSRDSNYLIDPIKMSDIGHPARAKAKGLAPGFLGVIPKMIGSGAKDWNVQPDWFREAAMLFRTSPHPGLEQLARRRSRSSERQSGRNTPEPAPSMSDNSWAQKGIWGRQIGRQADISIAREWLHFCEQHHPRRCGRRRSEHGIPGFKLIDCTQSPPQLVEQSTNANYAALSYVHGSDITEKWPRVMRDAVTVTLELGLKYLWVDRFCIDNNRLRERMEHMSRMDEVFEGSVVTIVAAHGQNATYGLPGVASTSRPEQPHYRFADGNVTLVSSLPDPRVTIQESTWYTRGWTYQEALLARRRLIFTEQQMYWECEGMACPETLSMPLALYYDNDQERMCDFLRPGLFNGVSYIDGSWEVWKKLPSASDDPSTLSIFRSSDQHIIQYTKRKLTFDEDSLNAFLGISRRMEKTIGRGKLSSIVGIPLWCPAVHATARTGPPRTRVLFALMTCFWHHRSDAAAVRRRHLPSWTWAGWGGAVELHSSIVVADPENTGKERKLLHHHYVVATQVTRNDKSSMRWAYSPEMVVLSGEGNQLYDFTATSAPPSFPPGKYVLRVTNPLVLDKVKARVHSEGWIFNDLCVDVRLSTGRGTDARHMTGPVAANTPSPIREYLEKHARGEWMTLLWLVEEALVMLLVVERTERGTWERVGRARMAFAQDAKEIMARFGSLEVMLNHLPLRRLGQDILIE